MPDIVVVVAHGPVRRKTTGAGCVENAHAGPLFHVPVCFLGALLGGSAMFEDYIKTEIALCDFVQTKLRTRKQMMLSFDEYGSRMAPAALRESNRVLLPQPHSARKQNGPTRGPFHFLAERDRKSVG